MNKLGRRILISVMIVLIVLLLILSSLYIQNQYLKLPNTSSDNPLKATENYTWTQDKTMVTNGEVTLEVGSKITGYEANGVSDWYVLGAESGRLLLTTGVNTKIVSLYGYSSNAIGESTLNSAAYEYRNTLLSGSARSINVNDINRVTGYSTSVHALDFKDGYDYYNNSITYEYGNFTSPGGAKVTMRFKGTKTPLNYYYITPQAFYYPSDSSTGSLNRFTSGTKTFKSTIYKYYPQTLSTTYSAETSINGSSLAYNLLFANTSGNDNRYWLANKYISLNAGGIAWRYVFCI